MRGQRDLLKNYCQKPFVSLAVACNNGKSCLYKAGQDHCEMNILRTPSRLCMSHASKTS